MQTPDLVVPHAVILGQNDLDGVPAYLKLATKTENHISEAANLGDRRELRGNHDNEHEKPCLDVVRR